MAAGSMTVTCNYVATTPGVRVSMIAKQHDFGMAHVVADIDQDGNIVGIEIIAPDNPIDGTA